MREHKGEGERARKIEGVRERIRWCVRFDWQLWAAAERHENEGMRGLPCGGLSLWRTSKEAASVCE